MTDKLIIFTRYPEAGTTKTRLVNSLGAKGAADLQRQMTEKVLAETRKCPTALEVRYYGGSNEQVAAWLGNDIVCRDQGKGDLGKKLARAFEESFAEGCRKVVIIGSDCPELTADMIGKAFTALSDNDLVIGPASDGGYYLVGLSSHCPELFSDQRWGTASLRQSTLAIADSLSLKYKLLAQLDDVDLPEDLARISHISDLKPSLSVIIPTLNEEENLPRTLEALVANPALEIIIADGGSSDKTLEIASDAGVRLVQCPAGRGSQLNDGARAARSDIFLFLHADTILPDNFIIPIRKCLAKTDVVAGAFRLAIDLPGSGIRLIEKGANFRSEFFQMPYGDQGIFIRKERFEAAGGFPEIEIMEDFALMRILKRSGRIELLEMAATTSGRRWRNKGRVKTTLINQAMIIGYLLGFSPTSLASWYRSSSRASS